MSADASVCAENIPEAAAAVAAAAARGPGGWGQAGAEARTGSAGCQHCHSASRQQCQPALHSSAAPVLVLLSWLLWVLPAILHPTVTAQEQLVYS